MLNGTKTMTSRTKKYGNVGDTFYAFGTIFELIEVGKLQLGDIASCWREEGMNNPYDFLKTWKQIHPNKPYCPTEKFHIHRFKKVSP
jgi:hypothetical protein